MGSVPSPALGVSGDALAAELRRRLLKLGFDTVRFAVPAELPAAGALRAWLAQGMHADMAWMERSADKRADPAGVLPGVPRSSRSG